MQPAELSTKSQLGFTLTSSKSNYILPFFNRFINKRRAIQILRLLSNRLSPRPSFQRLRSRHMIVPNDCFFPLYFHFALCILLYTIKSCCSLKSSLILQFLRFPLSVLLLLCPSQCHIGLRMSLHTS